MKIINFVKFLNFRNLFSGRLQNYFIMSGLFSYALFNRTIKVM